MIRIHPYSALFLAVSPGITAMARAADIVAGDVTAALGPEFFVDDAVIGGGDNNATVFTRDLVGLWTAGATVTLKGIGWASGSTGTSNTSVTVTFSEAGPDGALGTTDDVIVGTVTDNLVFSGASEYPWPQDNQRRHRPGKCKTHDRRHSRGWFASTGRQYRQCFRELGYHHMGHRFRDCHRRE